MKFLFFLGHDGFIRNFEPMLAGLAHRGHAVQLALTGRRETLMSESASIEDLCARYPSVAWTVAPKPRGRRSRALEGLSRSRNYLRYLETGYSGAAKLRERAAGYAPRPFRFAAPLLARSRLARQWMDAALAWAVRRLGTDSAVDSFVRAQKADAVLFTPLVGFGFGQHAPLRSAKRLGIPTAMLVHSWDNLTNKGLIHELPERVVVWNEAQKAEAETLHRVPAGRIVVTGAQAWDEWFERRPSTTREEFCRKVGIDPVHPFVLYVGSSGFIAPDEALFVEQWLRALRSADDPALREVGVVLRAHPQNEVSWSRVQLAEGGRAAIWPPLGAPRSGPDARAGYFDSIFHCGAVVGINTSALIESAIVGRPVLTLLDPQFHDTQEGTLHFHHLTGDGDAAGMLAVARTPAEHHAQLAAALNNGAESAGRGSAFVARFVRPHGLDEPATPHVVRAVETLAERA